MYSYPSGSVSGSVRCSPCQRVAGLCGSKLRVADIWNRLRRGAGLIRERARNCAADTNPRKLQSQAVARDLPRHNITSAGAAKCLQRPAVSGPLDLSENEGGQLGCLDGRAGKERESERKVIVPPERVIDRHSADRRAGIMERGFDRRVSHGGIWGLQQITHL